MKNIISSQRFGIPFEKKEKRKCKIVFRILLVIFLLVFLCGVTILVQTFIQRSIKNLAVTNDLNATWISSLASYWGGIIGGLISGLLTVVGVILTIKYYRDSDATKNRVIHMPFLKMEVIGCTDEEIIANGVNLYEINSNTINNDVSNEKILYYRMKLWNIGQGFANTLVIYTGETFGGIAYNELIQVNDSGEFCFKIHAGNDICGGEISFGVSYIDCMTNEYIQSYTIYLEGKDFGNAKVENGYPVFIGQTHAIDKS
ncbi:hypothetical protein SAMN02745245_01216 [Anaerosphaera aminiphila DSM 21120]|uniref:Uncharacterized protein n=1 Tax=Anaerosphaera aminiphila DSM 21120 TaxID=1120995 RepID=A0A1M5SJT3_9FIRM|nr:hypothetical protein [Anaerosphaera aminiphila]SHH38518.1 hypothetical protein SAMN02745245_01216 [Anaerosphaera aminiphila DSM 21120]